MTRNFLLSSLLAIQNTIVRGSSRTWPRQASALKSWLTSALIVGALSVCAAPYMAGQTWNGFSAAASPAVSWPEGVAVGDFDGSGHLGFATCDTNGYVYVFLGNGDGTFTAAVPTAAPYCSTLVAGDFNGDGKLDLAVTNNNYDTITILLGNGNGTFTQAASLALGTNNNPTALAVGDFNNDGKLDLAVGVTVGSPSDLVKIFLGNGNGTFTPGPVLTLGAYQPYGIAVGDFTGNGNLDLAVADLGSAKVTVLLGNGNGTFAAGVQYATGSSPWGITTGDFNNDGKLDLAIANEGSNNVTVLLGNGNGTFTAAASPATGKFPCGIVAADFNGNGNLDLAVVNQSAKTVTILLGNGNGTFTAAPGTPATRSGPMAIGVGDWNGDGFPDLVVANYGSSNMTVLLNNGPFPTATTLAVSPNPVIYGNPLSLTATIANNGIGGPSPTGTVTFYSDGTVVGSGSVSSNLANVTTSVLTVGTHTLTAQYSGSSSYNASTSSAITETVLKATPPVTVSCSPNPTTFGSSTTTCTGQTSAGATGLMSLTYNGTAWGSGNVNSSAAFSVSGLGGSLAGSYTIVATYAGDSNNNGGSGSTTYAINKATPTVTWATPAAITYGTALSATQLNATASTPGTFAYTPAAGTVLAAGAHTLSVTFTPTDTSDYTTASATVNLTVNRAVLTVTANNASQVYGTANPTLTPSYSGFVNGDTGAVLTGFPSLTTTATAASPTGSYTITAAAGTLSAANYSFAFVNGTLTITKATSSLSVTSTINPSTYGQSVTFTLTVAGSGSGVTPTGTVTLTKGGTTLLGTTVLSASGTATYTTSTLPTGVDTLQLNYSGDTNYF